MPDIGDAADQAANAGLPVLLLDTCCILDVIRAPERGGKLAGCVEAASTLTATPTPYTLVVGSFVPTEWDDNVQGVADSLIRHLEKMEEQAEHFHGLCRHLGIGLNFGRPLYTASTLADRLRELSRRLIDTAVLLDPHPDAEARAFNRVARTRRRPSRKGGELKDGTIFEEYLEFSRRLRGMGYLRKLVFCSSNTDDYCDPGVIPHPDVAADCAAVGLAFTTTLPRAVAVLKS
ncbi:MAG: hypothetical protein K2X82_24575 [Gemmataceae bacterium]|nr:hypothetical protein [Gemmataceae bacterium]